TDRATSTDGESATGVLGGCGGGGPGDVRNSASPGDRSGAFASCGRSADQRNGAAVHGRHCCGDGRIVRAGASTGAEPSGPGTQLEGGKRERRFAVEAPDAKTTGGCGSFAFACGADRCRLGVEQLLASDACESGL